MRADRHPTVSIVIPVYNGANYLGQAIESALAQTYPDTEVIVVNDGSDDEGKTHDVALSFGDRIRFFGKSNGGVASALNVGIREMRGEFFSWLSHDDLYLPEKIARQISYFHERGDDRTVLFCNYDVIDQASRVIGTGQIHEFARSSSIGAVLGTYVNGCSMLIPKSAFGAAGLFNESLMNSQDNEMWLRMVMQGYRLSYMPDILIQSRNHPEQGTKTAAATHQKETRAFYDWALRFIGPRERVENAVTLFRVLLMKRQLSKIGRLFFMLSGDRSPYYAMSSMCRGAFAVAKTAVVNRFGGVPGVGWLLRTLRKRRFRNSSHYWEQRYKRGENSGAGSYGRYAEFKAGVLNAFISTHGIRKVADFGCGDGNQLKTLKCAQYLGLDVSATAVDKCRQMYAADPTKAFLLYNDPDTRRRLQDFAPELTISLDVIYHLVERTAFEDYIRTLFDAASSHVIIYSSNFERQYDSPTQLDRRFTEYIATHIPGWKLVEMIPNPHKGAETQSDFYVYQRTANSD